MNLQYILCDEMSYIVLKAYYRKNNESTGN